MKKLTKKEIADKEFEDELIRYITKIQEQYARVPSAPTLQEAHAIYSKVVETITDANLKIEENLEIPEFKDFYMLYCAQAEIDQMQYKRRLENFSPKAIVEEAKALLEYSETVDPFEFSDAALRHAPRAEVLLAFIKLMARKNEAERSTKIASRAAKVRIDSRQHHKNYVLAEWENEKKSVKRKSKAAFSVHIHKRLAEQFPGETIVTADQIKTKWLPKTGK